MKPGVAPLNLPESLAAEQSPWGAIQPDRRVGVCMLRIGGRNMGTRTKVKRGHKPQRSELARLLHQLANNCKHPARLIELYYWSREPELAEIMRQIVSLPEEAKGTLHAFFNLAKGDVASISVTVSADGDVTLTSPVVAELFITMMQTSAKAKSTNPLH
jgi:hypothetical protein